MPPSARAEWRDDLRSGLPLQARREWNNCVDEELRCELLARRDEDQRIRTAVRPPKGQYMVQLPDEAAAGGRASMRTTPGGSGKSSTARAGPGGPWWVRTAPLRRGCWPSTLTAISSGSRRSCRPCAAQSIRARRLRPTWPIWRTGCGSMLASLSGGCPDRPHDTKGPL